MPRRPRPDAATSALPSQANALLHDGDIIEIRGARLRVIASGTSPHPAKAVAHLRLVGPAQAHQPTAARTPVLEASPALMALIAEQFGIKEAQPHRLQAGQATWIRTLIKDYSVLAAGASFHAGLLPGWARAKARAPATTREAPHY